LMAFWRMVEVFNCINTHQRVGRLVILGERARTDTYDNNFVVLQLPFLCSWQ
jgi:hypothetical protein